MSIYRFTEGERAVYEAICRAFDRLEDFADVSDIEPVGTSLINIMLRVIAVHPYGYCYDPTYISRGSSGTRRTLRFRKCTETETGFISFCSAVEFEREGIINAALGQDSTYDRILSVYRYFVDRYEYSSAEEDSVYSPASQHISGKSVCEGFALAFSEIMTKLGITCDIVRGKSLSSDSEGGHMWNIVRLDRECYHLDVTWDICTKRKGEAYNYFLLSDADIGLDHSWDTSKFPPCNDDSMEWYRHSGAYVRSTAELEGLIKDRVAKRNDAIAFRYSKDFRYEGSITRLIKACAAGSGVRIRDIIYSSNDTCRIMRYKIEY